ncbi:MAG: ECF transporter S component [Parasporobacterium sp.]|nr:ECF transporter S component [Parasporobacterium sp.]
MKRLAVLDLTMCAVSIALHIVLELFLTIRIGNDLKITLAALPFLVIAFLCGPLEGLISGIVGTFLSQLLTFGVTITTPFWVLPYAAQGLLAGLLFRAFRCRITVKTVGISVFVSGLLSVILTWFASYLDGVVFFKYMTLEVLIGLIPLRLLVWVIISVIYTAVILPVSMALLKSCPAGLKIKRE